MRKSFFFFRWKEESLTMMLNEYVDLGYEIVTIQWDPHVQGYVNAVLSFVQGVKPAAKVGNMQRTLPKIVAANPIGG